MRSLGLLSTLGVLAVPLAAQTFSVVPSRAATSQEGKWYSVGLIYGTSTPGLNASHTQCLFDTADVSQIAGLLNGVAIRRNNYLGGTQAGTTVNVLIDTSVSSITHNTASTTFSSNHGANRQTVFNGPVSLPARTMGPWPEPWENTIAFTTPMPYARPMGASLVVDFVVTGNTAQNVWYADAYTLGYGSNTLDLYQSNCKHSEGGASNSWGYFTYQPYPGGQFTLNLSNMPGNVPSFGANRLIFGLRGTGGMFGPFPLPVAFATLGIPSPATCQFSVEFVFDVPMGYRTGTVPNGGSLNLPTFTFPNDPSLAGASFVTQGIALDTNPVTMTPEVFPTVGIKWTVGSGNPVPATTVQRLADSTPPSLTGSVTQSMAVVLQLRFQ